MNKRQKEVLEAAFKDEKKVIQDLQKVYKDAEKEIDDKIAQLLGRSDSNMQHVIYQVEYQKAMKAQIGAILDTMQANQFSFVSEYLTKCYEEGFVGTMYDLQGQGIPLCFPLDQRQVAKAVKLDSKISKGLYSRLGEDVAALKTKISAEISRGIATGASFNQIAQNLAGHSRIGFNNAIRIVRTEGGRITNEAKMEALTRSKAMGADIVKQWDSTLDMKTRPSHRAVDGEVKELEEKFSNGLRFPGDPHGKAAEVINCRCCLLQRARSEFDKEGNERDFTKMNNETGEIMHFDITLDYNNFKKQYWGAAAKIPKAKETTTAALMMAGGLTNIVKGGIIPVTYHDFRTIEQDHSIDVDIGSKEAPACNPGYASGKREYTRNCGYCSATYEMRRRGYDVVAKGKDGLYVDEWGKLFVDAEVVSFKPLPLPSRRGKTLTEHLEQLNNHPTIEKQLSDQLLSLHEEGARGSVYVKWKGKRDAHFFSWEIENGRIRYIDGQNGSTDVSHYFDRADASSIKTVRWDNLEPSDMITEACTNRKGK